MKTSLYTLKNGLRVILVDTESFPSATTLLLVGAGSRYETQKNNGIAHFFEHMAFKGSKKYPSAFKISSLIDGLGGVFNAFTSKDYTGYYIKAPTRHFTTSIDVIADMIQHPLLKQEEIDRERGVIVEEINMYEDSPARDVYNVYESLLYKGHPLGFMITGDKASVSGINRQTFLDYINSFYHPNNAVLVVSGGLTHNEFAKDMGFYKELISHKFSSWKKKEVGMFKKYSPSQKKSRVLVKHKRTEQYHFLLGFRSFSFLDKRRWALSILSSILGGGMSSRLFVEIREKRGLAYYVGTSVEAYHDTGSLILSAGVRADRQVLSQAIELMIAECRKVAKGEVTKKELRKVKDMAKGRFLLSLEDSSSVASYYGNLQLLERRVEQPQDAMKRIEAVTMDQVVQVAHDIIRSDGLNMAAIGEIEEKNVKKTLKL